MHIRKLGAAICSSAVMAATPLAAAPSDPPPTVTIRAGALPWVRTSDQRFQSFQIGMSHLTGGETWKSYDPSQQAGTGAEAKTFAQTREARQPADLTSRRLRTLTAALAPLYIRYGGTTSNSVYFQDNDAVAAQPPTGFSVVLTRSAWKGAIDFAHAVGAKIVTGFTVSNGVRDAQGAWTPRMAAPWLAYTHAAGGEIYAAELFNEPNAPDPAGLPKGETPQDFARDFARLRTFVRAQAPHLKLAGPGVATLGIDVPSLDGASPDAYMAAEPKPQFDIVSYHFYGAVAERCAPPGSPMGIAAADALSEGWLTRPDRQFQRHKALRDRYAPRAPIWLTETGAAACGGPRWQPTFIDTFRFLDAQGRLAKQGLDAIFHHALISGSNGLLDEKTFLPNADFWAALLWHRLMGSRVLDAGASPAGLHLYAHCTPHTSGGVTLLAINLETTPAVIRVPGPAEVYALSAPELQSPTVLLNGRPLALGSSGRLPAMAPARVRGGLTIAPTSIAFVTLPAAANLACRTK